MLDFTSECCKHNICIIDKHANPRESMSTMSMDIAELPFLLETDRIDWNEVLLEKKDLPIVTMSQHSILKHNMM